jgi:hypothetical protein
MLHAIMDDGTKLTIPHVTMGETGETQEIHFLQVLEGEHVEGVPQYRGAIVRLGDPYRRWLRYPGFSGPLEFSSLGRITLTASDAVQFTNLPNVTQDEIERQLVQPLLNLLMLASGQVPDVQALELHPAESEGSPDRAHSVRRKRKLTTGNPGPEPLPIFSIGRLGNRGLNAWYGLNQMLTPVCSVIGKTIAVDGYDIESKLLNLAASAEAVHRTLYNTKRMTELQASEVRQAALEGVPEACRKLVGTLLSNLSEPSYSDRLAELLDRIGPLANGIAGELHEPSGSRVGRACWLRVVTRHRNDFAHLNKNTPEDLRHYAGRTFVLYESLRWLLSAVLLCHSGVSPVDVQADFNQSSPFALFRDRARLFWPEIYNVTTK